VEIEATACVQSADTMRCDARYLEDGGGGLQLVTTVLTEHEERHDVAGDAKQDDRRRQPDFHDVPQ